MEVKDDSIHFALGVKCGSLAPRITKKINVKLSTYKKKLHFIYEKSDILSYTFDKLYPPLFIPCASPSLEIELRRSHSNYWDRMSLLEKYLSMAIIEEFRTNESDTFMKTLSFTIPNLYEYEINFLQNYINIEVKYKWLFKKLLNTWLYKHYRERLFNTSDPITCETPENPVFLFSVSQRGNYVFERDSIKKHIEIALKHNEYIFPKPYTPKNPFTNIPLSIAHQIAIIENIRYFGRSSWIIEGFRHCKYNLRKFASKFYLALKIEAIHDLCRNSESEESQEHFTEFLEYMFEQFNISTHDYKIKILRWAVKHKDKDAFIKEWRKLYVEYYTIKYQYPGLYEDDFAYASLFRKANISIMKVDEYKRLEDLLLESG